MTVVMTRPIFGLDLAGGFDLVVAGVGFSNDQQQSF